MVNRYDLIIVGTCGAASTAATRVRAASRASYSPGTEFQIDRIEMVGNTGTYLDTPYHRDDTSGGRRHVIFEPEDFIARLAALVPKPRAHLTRSSVP